MPEHKANPTAQPSSIEVRNSSAAMLEEFKSIIEARGNATQEEIIQDILSAETLDEIVDSGMVWSVDRDHAIRDIPFRINGFRPFLGDKVDQETKQPTVFLTFDCEALSDIDELYVRKGDRVLINDGGKVVLAQAMKLYKGNDGKGYFPITLMFHVVPTGEGNEVHRLIRPRPKIRVKTESGAEVSG